MFFNFRSSKPRIRIIIQSIMLDPNPELFTRQFPGIFCPLSRLYLPTIHRITSLPPFPISLLKSQALLIASSCSSWTRWLAYLLLWICCCIWSLSFKTIHILKVSLFLLFIKKTVKKIFLLQRRLSKHSLPFILRNNSWCNFAIF